MNTDLALEIVRLGLSLIEDPEQSVADTLLEIVQKANQAYQDHIGKPLDPFLIQPKQTV